MNRGGDILDGFFVSPGISLNQGGGSSASWGAEQQQQQALQHQRRPPQQSSTTLQPHTPDISIDVATTSVCSSTTNNGEKDTPGLPKGRGDADYGKMVLEPTAAELGLNGNLDRVGRGNRNSRGDAADNSKSAGDYIRTGVESGIKSAVPSAASGNEGYVPLGSQYLFDVDQRMLPQAAHHMQPNIQAQLNATSPPSVDPMGESNVGSDAGLHCGDNMLEQLLSSLEDSRERAKSFLMHLMGVAPLATPVAATLSQLVANLEEGIANIKQSRGLFSLGTMINEGAALRGMGGDVPRDSSHALPQQAQPQQQRYRPGVADVPLFTGSAVPVRYGDRGAWHPPQGRGPNGECGSTMDIGCPTVTVGAAHQPHQSVDQYNNSAQKQRQFNPRRPPQRQQQQAPPPPSIQRQFEVGMLSADQMVPYTDGSGTVVGAMFPHQPLAAPNSGGESLPMFGGTAEAGAAFVDGMGSNNNNSGDMGGGTLGHGNAEIIRGPPYRPADPNPLPGSEEVEKFLAFVEFKRTRVRKYECHIDISPGQYVIVDGDRGRDCGLVVQTIKNKPDGTAALCCMDGCNVNSEKIKLEKGSVLGVATVEEVDYLHHTMQRAERIALETCRRVCHEMGININLLDCEYQFDMEKVSFYFNSEHSVDFRPLVRELYRTFRVRIWMENVNPRVKNSMPTGGGSTRGDNRNGNHNSAGGESDGMGDDAESVPSDCGDPDRNYDGQGGGESGNGCGRRRGAQRASQRQRQGKGVRN